MHSSVTVYDPEKFPGKSRSMPLVRSISESILDALRSCSASVCSLVFGDPLSINPTAFRIISNVQLILLLDEHFDSPMYCIPTQHAERFRFAV